jgi:hypothetical protein
MPKFFAVVGPTERRGPFLTIKEAIALLRDISEKRGYTAEQAHHFFVSGSAIEEEHNVGDKIEYFRLGWLAREQWGRLDENMQDTCLIEAA